MIFAPKDCNCKSKQVKLARTQTYPTLIYHYNTVKDRFIAIILSDQDNFPKRTFYKTISIMRKTLTSERTSNLK